MDRSRYGSLSLWLDQVSNELRPRPVLPGDRDADVAIVGAGYTGLWTAYYLLKAEPSLRVVLIEKEIAGAGASGRNGGWCSALFAASRSKIAKRYGRQAASAMQEAMFDTVDEVGRVGLEESIDFDFHKGGTLGVATAASHVDRLKEEVEHERGWGFGPEHFRWLEPEEAAARIGVRENHGAAFTPHCARIHPAKLARGLARVVEGLGATIYEGTEALNLAQGSVSTVHGRVKADVVVRATEAYTAALRGSRRRLVPLYSLMIATEPLDAAVWEDLRWQGNETFHDGRHLLIYAQRTADDRIAIGGRGAPYHFASRIDPAHDREPRVFQALTDVVRDLFPAAAEAKITHTWGGPLGAPRDWFTSAGYDPDAKLAWAGGYVGDGVSTTNLAGRTLRDLILRQATELTALPWVNHHSRSWEPEPLRWIGINSALKLMAHADAVEARKGRPTKRGALIKRLIGM